MRSLDLLAMAEARADSIRALSVSLGLNPTALGKAKHDGKLSPAVAAALACEMGEDPARWALIAASESDKNPPALARRLAAAVRSAKSYVSTAWLCLARRASDVRIVVGCAPRRRPISA